MKISFDLDDTIIPSTKEDFPTEKRSLLQRILGIELLREGTGEVIRKLQASGNTVGIYTTSYRSTTKIRFQFWTYGISVDFVINETLNRKTLSKTNVHTSKYPPAFHIDLHIDDSEGVAREGHLHNFTTIIIKRQDSTWQEKILNSL
ncbi:MAG: HAD family hydrolase [Bacteroidota bacterium]